MQTRLANIQNTSNVEADSIILSGRQAGMQAGMQAGRQEGRQTFSPTSVLLFSIV